MREKGKERYTKRRKIVQGYTYKFLEKSFWLFVFKFKSRNVVAKFRLEIFPTVVQQKSNIRSSNECQEDASNEICHCFVNNKFVRNYKKKKTFMADRVYLTFNWKILSQAHILVLSENKEETSHSSVNTVSNAQAFSKLHAISTNQSRFHSSRSSKRIMLQAMLLFRDRKPVS